MNHPTRIHVGPFTYTLTSNAADYNAVSARDERFLLGLTEHNRLRITLDPNQPDAAMRDTVLHETLHAITRMTALDDELGDKTEEAVVARITPALLDVLRRNPKLVAYLTG